MVQTGIYWNRKHSVGKGGISKARRPQSGLCPRPFLPLIFFFFYILFPQPRQKIHNKRWYCLSGMVRKIYYPKKWPLLDRWPWLVKALFDKPTPEVAWEGIAFPRQWVGRMVFLLCENIISLPLTPFLTAFPLTSS